MLNYNPVTKRPGMCLFVGRGAIAIKLALSEVSQPEGSVIVPSNICYAAVLPIIYAGYHPIFCDVDPKCGNVTLQSISDYITSDTVAAVIPHMYGNPVVEMLDIYEYLHNREIVVIEDCASLMALDGTNYIPGTIGDYVVYSTGYSKTIDIGFGGILFSEKRDLYSLEQMEKSMNAFSDSYETEWSIFSSVYRTLRNKGQDSAIAKAVYHNLPSAFQESFTFRITEEQATHILQSVENLKSVISERRRQHQLYLQALNSPAEMIYPYSLDAVPWRFSMLIGEERKNFIEYCLEHNLPVSDWYPLVTPIFGDDGYYPGAEWHEKHIVNFPLMIPDERIIKICEIVNQYYRGAFV